MGWLPTDFKANTLSITYLRGSHKNYNLLKGLISKFRKRHLGQHGVHLHLNFCYHKENPFILPLSHCYRAQVVVKLELNLTFQTTKGNF